MSEERKPLPETGFRCYKAEPEKITCNMTIIVDQMLSWLEAEKASGENIKKDGKGQHTIKLVMAETTRQDAQTSHYFRYDDFVPDPQRERVAAINSQEITSHLCRLLIATFLFSGWQRAVVKPLYS